MGEAKNTNQIKDWYEFYPFEYKIWSPLVNGDDTILLQNNLKHDTNILTTIINFSSQKLLK